MEKVKVIKLLSCNVKMLPRDEISEQVDIDMDPPINIKYITSDREKLFYPYLSVKECNQYESGQYKALLTDIKHNKDFDIVFSKLILPTNFPMDLILSNQELVLLREGQYQSIIFDITEFFDYTCKDFLRECLNDLYRILLSFPLLKTVIIITKIYDKDYEKFVNTYKLLFEEIHQLDKKFIFIEEDGYSSGYEIPRRETPNFLKEHIRFILTKQENKYYGHYEVSERAHTFIFQYFEKLLSDYGDIFFHFFRNILEEKIESSSIDGLVSFVYPINPFGTLGGRLEESLKIKYFGFDKNNDNLPKCLRGNITKVMLLTDVIYSKTTANRVIDRLSKEGIKVEEIVTLTTDIKSDFSDMAILLKPLIRFHLPWWKPKKCPLCEFGSSLTLKKTVPAERTVLQLNFNPFEFYKFVKECNALNDTPRETLGRNCYRFYYDISAIFHKFGIHIARVLWKKIEQKTEMIEAIVCPEDQNAGAILLSLLLSEVSRMSIPVICIKRKDIKNWREEKNRLAIAQQYKELENKFILLVDDGINTQSTMKSIRQMCEHIDVKDILGSAVFLIRLPIDRVEDLKDVQCFYHWASPPFKHTEFPYQIRRSNER